MRVYIAGKYSADNVLDVLGNIHDGIKASAEVLKYGMAPFCPFLDYQFHFFDKTLNIEDYHRYSMAWLEVSGVVFVLPDSENSKGTQAEIKRAEELGIKIVYNMKDLLSYYGSNGGH